MRRRRFIGVYRGLRKSIGGRGSFCRIVRSAARAGAVKDRQPGSGENLPDHCVEHNDSLETLASVKYVRGSSEKRGRFRMPGLAFHRRWFTPGRRRKTELEQLYHLAGVLPGVYIAGIKLELREPAVS
jgi:hypothetical protein